MNMRTEKISSNFKTNDKWVYMQIRGVPKSYHQMFRRLHNESIEQWKANGSNGMKPIQADILVKLLKDSTELKKIKG